MPVRHKAVTWLTEQFTGVHVWDGRTGECLTMPTEQYEQARAAADQVYLALMGDIDWSRVLIEALGRCAHLDHDRHDSTHGWGMHPCGESVHAAVTSTRTVPRWADEPGPIDASGDDDHARTLADATTHRRPAHPRGPR